MYFDLLSPLNKQIDLLNQHKPKFIKTYQIDNQKETITTREINWSKELELFLQADLNKQSYQNSYQIINYNSQEVVYSLKKEEHLPVKWLRIKTNPKGIDVVAEIFVDNYLYTSTKQISLQIIDNKLQQYEIKGWQKLLIGNKKTYAIKGKLVQE